MRDELLVRLNALLEGRPAVLPGCEYFFSAEALALLDKGGLGPLTGLNRSRYLLVELPPDALPSSAEAVFHEFRIAGVTPVIAHPERHPALSTGAGAARASRVTGGSVPGDGRQSSRRLRRSGRGILRGVLPQGLDSLHRFRRAQPGSTSAAPGGRARARSSTLGGRGRGGPLRGEPDCAHRLRADSVAPVPPGIGGREVVMSAPMSSGAPLRTTARRQRFLAFGCLCLAVIASATFGRDLVLRRGAAALLAKAGIAARPGVQDSFAVCERGDLAAAFATEAVLEELAPGAPAADASARYEARGRASLAAARELAALAVAERPGSALHRLALGACWLRRVGPRGPAGSRDDACVAGRLSDGGKRGSRPGSDLVDGGRCVHRRLAAAFDSGAGSGNSLDPAQLLVGGVRPEVVLSGLAGAGAKSGGASAGLGRLSQGGGCGAPSPETGGCRRTGRGPARADRGNPQRVNLGPNARAILTVQVNKALSLQRDNSPGDGERGCVSAAAKTGAGDISSGLVRPF